MMSLQRKQRKWQKISFIPSDEDNEILSVKKIKEKVTELLNKKEDCTKKGNEIKVTNKVKKLLQRKKECSKKNNNSENLIKKKSFLKIRQRQYYT